MIGKYTVYIACTAVRENDEPHLRERTARGRGGGPAAAIEAVRAGTTSTCRPFGTGRCSAGEGGERKKEREERGRVNREEGLKSFLHHLARIRLCLSHMRRTRIWMRVYDAHASVARVQGDARTSAIHSFMIRVTSGGLQLQNMPRRFLHRLKLAH